MTFSLEHLEALEAKATGKEWEADHNGGGNWDVSVKGDFPIIADDMSECDALFIEYLRNHCKQIIAELRASRLVADNMRYLGKFAASNNLTPTYGPLSVIVGICDRAMKKYDEACNG